MKYYCKVEITIAKCTIFSMKHSSNVGLFKLKRLVDPICSHGNVHENSVLFRMPGRFQGLWYWVLLVTMCEVSRQHGAIRALKRLKKPRVNSSVFHTGLAAGTRQNLIEALNTVVGWLGSITNNRLMLARPHHLFTIMTIPATANEQERLYTH